jgi:hypothetical protein
MDNHELATVITGMVASIISASYCLSYFTHHANGKKYIYLFTSFLLYYFAAIHGLSLLGVILDSHQWIHSLNFILYFIPLWHARMDWKFRN